MTDHPTTKHNQHSSLILPPPEATVPAVLNGGVAEKAKLVNIEPHGVR